MATKPRGIVEGRPPAEASGATGAVGGSEGSSVRVVNTERRMKSLLLVESDLQNITNLSGGAGVCLSFASFLGALRFDIFKDTALAGAIPPETAEALHFINPILAFSAISFLIAAGVLWYKRGTELKRIKNESRTIGGE